MGNRAGSENQNTTTRVILPDWLDTAAQNNLNVANEVAGRPYQQNPYSTVAPLSADQLAAFQGIRDLQGDATGSYDAAIAQTQGLLGEAAPITAGQVTDYTTQLMDPYIGQVVDTSAARSRDEL